MPSLQPQLEKVYDSSDSRQAINLPNFGLVRERRILNNGSIVGKSPLQATKRGSISNSIPVNIIDKTLMPGCGELGPSFHVLGFTMPRPSRSLNSVNEDAKLIESAPSNDLASKQMTSTSGTPKPRSQVAAARSLGRTSLAGSALNGPRSLLVGQTSLHKPNHFHSSHELNRSEQPRSNFMPNEHNKPTMGPSNIALNSSGNNIGSVTSRPAVRLRDRGSSTISGVVRDEAYLSRLRQRDNMSMTINNFRTFPSSSQSLNRLQNQKNICNLPIDVAQRQSDRCDSCQRIYIVRHGERVDSTFGINWLDVVFDNKGKYRRVNINLPRVIPRRRNSKDFLFDPPLTEVGLVHSRFVGEELDACGTHIKHCYSSPALRCIQTATKILEGMNRSDIPIRIEPCLFEFLKWHPVMPLKSPFMDVEELRSNGFHIDTSYKTVYPLESLRKDEDEAMYYTRSHTVMQQIIRNHEFQSNQQPPSDKTADTNGQAIYDNESDNDQRKAENILIVAHAPTLEVATRQLTGGNPRVADLKFLVRQIPYLSIQTVERQQDNSWKLRKPPIPPMKHSAVEPFDWRYMR